MLYCASVFHYIVQTSAGCVNGAPRRRKAAPDQNMGEDRQNRSPLKQLETVARTKSHILKWDVFFGDTECGSGKKKKKKTELGLFGSGWVGVTYVSPDTHVMAFSCSQAMKCLSHVRVEMFPF